MPPPTLAPRLSTRDVVAERLDLAELVGDHQDGDLAAMRHVSQQAQDFVGFARRQHRGRLVEDQKPLIEIEQLQDLELLLLARRERRHRPVERHPERHARQGRLRALSRSLRQLMTAGASARLTTRFSAAVSDGHESEMLIDHADAERLRVARISHRDLGAVEQERCPCRACRSP